MKIEKLFKHYLFKTEPVHFHDCRIFNLMLDVFINKRSLYCDFPSVVYCGLIPATTNKPHRNLLKLVKILNENKHFLNWRGQEPAAGQRRMRSDCLVRLSRD